MSLNIHLACGGTGGHIFPGLATARVLRDRGHQVTLWMAGKDVEQTAVRGWDGEVITVPTQGLPTGVNWIAVRSAWSLFNASRICMAHMRRTMPDVLLAMGSYASVGPALAAFRLRIPVVLHESNVIPGRAIGLLSRRAQAVAAVFEETRFYLKRREIVITGMPLRRELVAAQTGEAPPPRAPGEGFTLLVMGGSRGAHRLNQLVTEAVAEMGPRMRRLRMLHLTGPADEEAVSARYAGLGVEHEVHAFFADMAALYRRADLVICRSGAATCAELCAFGLPALLVPYPFAARNHQFANAQAMARYGAADLVEEKDLESDWLADYIGGMMRVPARLARMGSTARGRALCCAAEALADLVEQSAHERKSAVPA